MTSASPSVIFPRTRHISWCPRPTFVRGLNGRCSSADSPLCTNGLVGTRDAPDAMLSWTTLPTRGCLGAMCVSAGKGRGRQSGIARAVSVVPWISLQSRRPPTPESADAVCVQGEVNRKNDPPSIVVELTEHAAVEDYDPLEHAIDRLRRQGIRLAIDDAGAGFASLKHIVRLRPEFIKLDLFLIRDIHQDPVKRAVVAGMLGVACAAGQK